MKNKKNHQVTGPRQPEKNPMANECPYCWQAECKGTCAARKAFFILWGEDIDDSAGMSWWFWFFINIHIKRKIERITKMKTLKKTLIGTNGEAHIVTLCRDKDITSDADQGFNIQCSCGAHSAHISECTSGHGRALDDLYGRLASVHTLRAAKTMLGEYSLTASNWPIASYIYMPQSHFCGFFYA